jgi:hypothetical protein
VFFSGFDLLMTVFWTGLFMFLISRLSFFQLNGIAKKWLVSVFVLKVIAGTLLAAIYTFYYTDRETADIYKYFDDSKIMTDALWTRPGDFFSMLFGLDNDNSWFSEQYYNNMNNWYRKYESNIYNDSHTIIRINALIRIFSLGSFHVHTVFSCFFSLIGLVGLYHAFRSFFSGKEKLLFVAVFLFPSVMFWSSGVLKEAYLILGTGIFLYGIFQWLNGKKSVFSVILILVGILFLLYLKVYVLMALLPGLMAYLILQWKKTLNIWLTQTVVIAICLLGWVYFEYLFPSWHMLEILVQKQQDFIRLSESMSSGSMIHLVPLEPNFLSFLQATPLAFFNVMFRPIPGESFSPFMLLASLENLAVMAGIVLAIVRLQKPDREQLKLLMFFVTFIIGLFVLIGWVTPVMGAIVRYKIPALPFLGMVIVLLVAPVQSSYQK